MIKPVENQGKEGMYLSLGLETKSKTFNEIFLQLHAMKNNLICYIR